MPSVTYTIDDALYAEYKQKVIWANPVPTEMDGSPSMAEDQWIKELIRRDIIGRYKVARDRWNAKQKVSEDLVT